MSRSPIPMPTHTDPAVLRLMERQAGALERLAAAMELLTDRLAAQNFADGEDRLLTVNEAAEIVGRSRETIYQLINRGMLPAHRVEGLRGVRISRRQLAEWLSATSLAQEG